MVTIANLETIAKYSYVIVIIRGSAMKLYGSVG
jgi:hypothetical protein